MNADDIGVGDLVRIGMGHTLWRVQGFWTLRRTGVRYASLGPVDSTTGYSTTSADPARLVLVTREGEQ